MASKKETLDFILAQLACIEGVSSRKMMGEYLIYYKGKVVAGVYDDRFLVKKTKGSVALLPDATEELPYEGSKPMLSLSDIVYDGHSDNAVLIEKVFEAVRLEI
jgi:TfoX/Sxy family transcriptional regulator of competence genes